MKSIKSMTVIEMAEWLGENPRHVQAPQAFAALTRLRGSMSPQAGEIADRALVTFKRFRGAERTP